MQITLIWSLMAGVLAASCATGEQRAGSALTNPGSERGDSADVPPPTVRSRAEEPRASTLRSRAEEPRASTDAREQAYAAQRARLVTGLRAEGIADERVLAALSRVPRHLMVPANVQSYAYADQALPIGHEQTISQPYVVALMTQLADLTRGEKVLEIGTGSGYQAAVLAELGAKVYSIEVVEPLGQKARALLDRLGYGDNVRTRIGDGYRGWPDAAPFDAIIITAAPPTIPEPLKRQLALGGKLVAPVGESFQQLEVLVKTEHGFERSPSIPVRFVPMVGEAQRHTRPR